MTDHEGNQELVLRALRIDRTFAEIARNVTIPAEQVRGTIKRLLNADKIHVCGEIANDHRTKVVLIYRAGPKPTTPNGRHPLDLITAQWAKPSMQEAA